MDSFLTSIGVGHLNPVNEASRGLVGEAHKNTKLPPADDTLALTDLFTYDVPVLGPEGTCSLPKKDDKHFDLAAFYTIPADQRRDSPHTFRLQFLRNLVQLLQDETAPDWLGIYRKVATPSGDVLVKEAYLGEMSRPIFPLTPEFQQISSNSTVGATGKARLIADVESFEGPYYECSMKVKSEFCVPILSGDGSAVLGIIDTESWKPNYFDRAKQLRICEVAYDLGRLPLFSQ